MKHAKTILSAAIMSLFAHPAAHAVQADIHAGDLLLRFREIVVAPDADSKIWWPITSAKVQVTTEQVPEMDLTYFFTDHVAVEVMVEASMHEMLLKGTTLGRLRVDSVWMIPPTVTMQYHFSDMDRFKPYLGAGFNYAHFYDKKGGNSFISDVRVDDNFGWALQAGLDYAVSESLYVNLDIKKIFLSTSLQFLVTIPIPPQPDLLIPVLSNVKIDPWIVGIGVGYKF